MHYLYIFEFWYVTSCLLVLTCSEDLKTVFETSWSTHHIYPPQHFIRVQYLQKTYHKEWSSKMLNFSLSKLILWRSISGRNFTYFNEQVSFRSSVSMCVGFKFACSVVTLLELPLSPQLTQPPPAPWPPPNRRILPICVFWKVLNLNPVSLTKKKKKFKIVQFFLQYCIWTIYRSFRIVQMKILND